MSALDRPALRPLSGAPDTRPVQPRHPRAQVPFRDSTIRLVTVTEWRECGGGMWACLLRWHAAGRPCEGWFIYDPALIVPETEAGTGGCEPTVP